MLIGIQFYQLHSAPFTLDSQNIPTNCFRHFRSAMREPHGRFNLAPDLLFDCSRVLENTKIGTVSLRCSRDKER